MLPITSKAYLYFLLVGWLALVFLLGCEEQKPVSEGIRDNSNEGPQGNGDVDGDSDSDSDGDGDSDVDSEADGDSQNEKEKGTGLDVGVEGEFDSDLTECAGVTEEAKTERVPGDIIIAVDNSGSMDLECAWVRSNLNDFADEIAKVDAHIAIITNPYDPDNPTVPDDTDHLNNDPTGNGICIDAPLGSGQCPDDTNLPRFKHIPETVQSNDALTKIIQTYDQWKEILRPDSSVNFLVVSDDNSLTMTGPQFTKKLKSFDPPIENFVFHGITASVGIWRPPCIGVSSFAGTVYHKLAQRTGGVNGDLCKQRFTPVFEAIAETMIRTSISCKWKIPDPPKGEKFDATKVNVIFTDDDGSKNYIGFLKSENDCEKSDKGGWYYDNEDNPTQVLVCPQTCTAIQTQSKGNISIQFGCKTIVVIV